ncbi:MAG: hypothetical protein ACRENP_18515 [Longimicrobiales bacterium]
MNVARIVFPWFVLGTLLAGSAGCHDDGTGADNGPSLRILAGADVADTISAAPSQGLVVQVRDVNGQTEAGVEVRFDASAAASLMRVSRVGDAFPSSTTAATTDANGRATVLIRFGERTGAGFIVLAVPLYDLTDTAHYTVRPGAPVRIALSPRDTALPVGATFRYRGSTVDRAGNARTDAATFESTHSAVTVDNNGNVAAVRVGSAIIRVRATIGPSTAIDSGSIAVVPDARVAWIGPSGNLVLTDLAGANRTDLASAPANAPSWAPTGDRLVFNRNGALWLVDLNGSVTALATTGVTNATWPEWARDGQWIYFQGDVPTGRHVLRVRPDGTGLQDLTTNLNAIWVTPSPDGRSVAYTPYDSPAIVMVQDIATGTRRTLAGTNSALALRWSPDGNWIAFLRCCQNEVMLARPDGSEVRRVPGHGLYPGFSWSRDSKWIIGTESRATLIDVMEGVMTYLPWSGNQPSWR